MKVPSPILASHRPTDYAADIEALFTSWNIVEARLDGSSEATIIADGSINSLPVYVYDPTGRYILYRSSLTFDEALLATRNGNILGRLIPNITRFNYFDWT